MNELYGLFHHGDCRDCSLRDTGVTLAELDKLCIEKFNLPSDYSCTRNIAQAWELLDKFSTCRWSVCLGYQEPYEFYQCSIDMGIFDRVVTLSEIAPLAITKACLKAVGVELE